MTKPIAFFEKDIDTDTFQLARDLFAPMPRPQNVFPPGGFDFAPLRPWILPPVLPLKIHVDLSPDPSPCPIVS